MALSTAAAIIGAGLIGGATSIIGGNAAADATTNAANQSNATQRYIYDTTRADYEPYRQVGYGALGKLANIYGVKDANGQPIGGSAANDPYGGYVASPGYQYRMDQAVKAIQNSAAARGLTNSGATLKAINRDVQGVAANDFQSYVNGLQSLAGVGQSATGTIANAGQQYASQTSQNNMNAANATASAYANTGNAINGGLTNIASAYLYNKGYAQNASAGAAPAASTATKSTDWMYGGEWA